MTLVSSLNIAQQGLLVNQSAITTVSNNIANVDNENYSKLEVNLADVVSYNKLNSPIEQANSLNGVQISSITRYSNAYLQNYYWSENSNYSYYDNYSTMASSVEDVVNELQNSGLSDAFSQFYSAVTALNSDPSSASAREAFSSSAQNVCSVFNSYYNSLENIQQTLVGDYTVPGSIDNSEISSEVDTTNNLLDQIAKINANIVQINAAGIDSNSILDERDSLISELSTHINATVTINSNGTANISMSGYKLVTGDTVNGYLDAVTGDAANPAQINIVKDPNSSSYSNILNSDVNNSITGGKIGAIVDLCGSGSSNFTINSVIDDLNTLASGFASIFNTIQTGDPQSDNSVAMCLGDIDSDGTLELTPATANLFVNSTSTSTTITTTTTTITNTATGITAGNIELNSDIINNLNLIAAARVSTTAYKAGTYTNDTGNNSNASLMSATQSNTYNSATSGADLNSETISDYLSNIVSDVGSKVSAINSNQSTTSTAIDQIKANLQSAKGVSLDTELSDLIKYQRSYQACARIFTVCSDLLKELIQLGS